MPKSKNVLTATMAPQRRTVGRTSPVTEAIIMRELELNQSHPAKEGVTYVSSDVAGYLLRQYVDLFGIMSLRNCKHIQQCIFIAVERLPHSEMAHGLVWVVSQMTYHFNRMPKDYRAHALVEGLKLIFGDLTKQVKICIGNKVAVWEAAM